MPQSPMYLCPWTVCAPAQMPERPANEEAAPVRTGAASERGSLGRETPTPIGSEGGDPYSYCFGNQVKRRTEIF